MKNEKGFSYMEMIVAMGIILVAMAVAFNFVIKFSSAVNTENTTLATQQSGRVVLDELTRQIQQIGFNVRRPDAFNPAVWQQSVVYGGSHHLVFNADINPDIGWLPSGETIALPGGGSYTGEGVGAMTAGAETYVYTLDADGNDAIEVADRTDAETGNYNPAAATDNPLDFALFRRMYGYNGTDYGGDLQPIGPYLLTNATADIQYPDGTTPDPLFVYWLTEDFNGDGRLSDEECVNDVVDTCPPATEREPLLYIWGDTDFDSVLSESEKTALRTMPVSSATWSKNRLVASGSYRSTTIATVTDPTSANPYEIEIADATQLCEGCLIQIGTGNSAELFYVEQISTSATPHRALLTSDVEVVHSVGTTVQILPLTLTRAIRTVGITYTAVADVADVENGKQAAGRSGRMGDKGLDYRVTPYRRKVEVINAPTSATSPDTAPSGADVCPLIVVNACSSNATEQSIRYASIPGAQPIEFLVTDQMGNPMTGVDVTFTSSDLSIGSLGDLTLKSNVSGIAAASYTPSGVLGVDTITATVECDTGGTTYTSDAENELTFYDVTTTIADDCLSTVSPRTPTPSTTYSLLVESPDGPVSNHDIKLQLMFDPSYLPTPPDFNAMFGELFVEGTSEGTTGSTGKMETITVTTDSNGLVSGQVDFFAPAGVSSRLNLDTVLIPPGCTTSASRQTESIDYFLLEHDSTLPYGGCTGLLPCTITAAMAAPRVEASLSFNGVPVPNAPLTFTSTDVELPSGTGDPAASVLIPADGIVTDASGIGEVIVSNNASPRITPLTPLKTQIDVSSAGDPLMCSSGVIETSSESSQFDFEAPANVCLVDMEQLYVVADNDDKFCVHFRNDNEADGCPMRIKGMQVEIFDAYGLNLDPGDGAKIKFMEGGGVSAIPDCDTDNKVTLFKDDCKSPKAILANGEVWMFQDFDSCSAPSLDLDPKEFFHIPKIQFDDDYPVGVPMDITVFFECYGDCNTGTVDQKTFRLRTP
jgi:type II secretory pathway pseudopilin PulG